MESNLLSPQTPSRFDWSLKNPTRDKNVKLLVFNGSVNHEFSLIPFQFYPQVSWFSVPCALHLPDIWDPAFQIPWTHPYKFSVHHQVPKFFFQNKIEKVTIPNSVSWQYNHVTTRNGYNHFLKITTIRQNIMQTSCLFIYLLCKVSSSFNVWLFSRIFSLKQWENFS